jgi:hypothetical protein
MWGLLLLLLLLLLEHTTDQRRQASIHEHGDIPLQCMGVT